KEAKGVAVTARRAMQLRGLPADRYRRATEMTHGLGDRDVAALRRIDMKHAHADRGGVGDAPPLGVRGREPQADLRRARAVTARDEIVRELEAVPDAGCFVDHAAPPL